jgi:hypothetical protein
MSYYSDTEFRSVFLENIYGVDIYYQADFQTFHCIVFNSELDKDEEIEGYAINEVVMRLKDILLMNYHASLESISNGIGEKRKNYNDPISHFGNVIDAMADNLINIKNK